MQYENKGVPVKQDTRRDDQVDNASKEYDGSFSDFYVTQQKQVTLRPVWQSQSESGPFEMESSDGRTYEDDSPKNSHPAYKRKGNRSTNLARGK